MQGGLKMEEEPDTVLKRFSKSDLDLINDIIERDIISLYEYPEREEGEEDEGG